MATKQQASISDKNKATLHRAVENWNKGELEGYLQLYDSQVVVHGLPGAESGVENVRQFYLGLWTGLPGNQLTFNNLISEGDKIAIRFTVTGTHRGEFMGMPSTGKPISVSGITIWVCSSSWAQHPPLGKPRAKPSPRLLSICHLSTVSRNSYKEKRGKENPQMTTGQKQSTAEKNKAIVQRLWDAVNQRNMDVVREICPPNYIHHDPNLPEKEYRSLDSYLQAVQGMMSAFPDIHIGIQELIAEGDKVVSRWSFSGTHKGNLMGMPPTNKQVSVSAIAIHRVANDRVVEGWVMFDTMGMMQQLGAVPS